MTLRNVPFILQITLNLPLCTYPETSYLIIHTASPTLQATPYSFPPTPHPHSPLADQSH
jgi:hypothetical protein